MDFLGQSGLDQRINRKLNELDTNDVHALAEAGSEIRRWVADTPFQPELETAINQAWSELCERAGTRPSVAVRSSATAEDLPDASFAGQQETYLSVRGIDNILFSVRQVFASLFNNRAISYRVHQGFDHDQVALSAGSL